MIENLLNAHELEQQFGYEHPGYPRSEYDASSHTLTVGYWEWVELEIDREANG